MDTKTIVPPLPLLFHQRIFISAENSKNELALTNAETGENIDFVTLQQRSLWLAHLLSQDYGLQKGEIMLCFMANNIQYPIIFLSGALIGCPLTGISPDFTKEEVCFYIDKTKCKAIFTTSELLGHVTEKAIDLNIPVFVLGKLSGQMGVDLEKLFEEQIEVFNERDLSKFSSNLTLDDVVLAPLSSGTSGTPKCVLLTHRNLNTATDILKSRLFDELSARNGRRTTIALLPFYHASGFWALCYCLLAGHHSVVMNKFQAPLLLSSIEDYKVDTLNLVPSIVNFLLKNPDLVSRFDLSSVTTILCGSAPMGIKQIKDFIAKFPHVHSFLQGYGMTEVVVLSHLCPLDLPSTHEKHLNSCGKLLPGFECKIVNSETGTRITECDQQGELWLKSDCVMKGYLDDDEETKMSLDSDGWYHTGDIVYYDVEGFFYVVGRLRNMIKVNGLQVSPIELENILLSHEDVLEAAVIGVPDDNRGEVPKAFIVLKTVENVGAKIEELLKFAHDHLAPFKQLHGGITSLTSLPKTTSGKVSKAQLKKLVDEEEQQQDEGCSETIL